MAYVAREPSQNLWTNNKTLQFKTAEVDGAYFSVGFYPDYSSGEAQLEIFVYLCGTTVPSSANINVTATIYGRRGEVDDYYSDIEMNVSDWTELGQGWYVYGSCTSTGTVEYRVNTITATINGTTTTITDGTRYTEDDLSYYAPMLTVADNVLGEAMSMSLNQQKLGFYYTAVITVGSYTSTVSIPEAAVIGSRSFTLTLPDSVAQQFMDDNSTTGTVTLTTYYTINGTERTLATTTATFTLSLPSTACATVDTLTASEGTASGFGYFVQLLSTVLLSASWTEWQDAQVNTISVYDGTALLKSVSVTEGDTSGTIEVPCSWSGSKTLTVKLTDQRGMVGSEDITVSATAYSVPSATLTYSVNDSTNLLTATVVYAISEVNSENAKTITIILTKLSDSTTETKTATLTDYSGTYSWTFSMIIEDTETYQIEAYVTDSAQDSVHAITRTGIVCISRLAGGRGVAMFGSAVASDAGYLNVHGDIKTDTINSLNNTIAQILNALGL